MNEFSTEDRQLLRDSVDRFIADYGFAARRTAQSAPDGFRRDLWRAMAEFGWLGLGLSEDIGGAGGGPNDVGILMEAIGKGLMIEPFLSSIVLGARLMDRLSASEQRGLLAAVISGEHLLALAHAEPLLGYARQPLSTRAVQAHGQAIVNGEKIFVLGGPAADTWLVSAVDDAGVVGVFLVPKGSAGVTVHSYATIDGRGAANLVLTNVPAVRLGGQEDVFETLDAALDYATVVMGREAVGSMSSVVERTNEHLKTRHQFGRPLAEFQVLRHRIVDMYIAMEETRSMVDVAAATLDAPPADRRAAVSALKVHLCRAARLIGQQGVQLHGGMGMTDKFPIGHYFKRLMMIEMLFGNADFHLRRYEEARRSMRRPSPAEVI